MIQFRKNPFSEDSVEIAFTEGENLKSLVDRTLIENGYELSENLLSHFNVVLNGHLVERDLWPFCQVKETDTILIAPRIARGEGGQLFKMVALIVVSVVAVVLTQGAAAPVAGGYWSAAGITIVGTLLLHALIPPPPVPGLGGLGSGSESSQMYVISSQSNTTKKFGSVPKVYGSHRMFPLVAANPYTEIESDPVNGTLIQYFYAIYDFGLGPLEVSDIRIGDTAISEYADTQWRLVDLNRPQVSEGPWDDLLSNKFSFYKGDVERDGTQYALDKSEDTPGVQELEYRVVRNASDNVNGNTQEISLDFVCPQGLSSYGTNGKSSKRTIELKVEFSKVNENVWRPYNDFTYVDDASFAGGSIIFKDHRVAVEPFNTSDPSLTNYALVSVSKDKMWKWELEGNLSPDAYIDHDSNPLTPRIKIVSSSIKGYGYEKGTTKILLSNSSSAGVSFANGDSIFLYGDRLGAIVAITESPIPGYSFFELDRPLSKSYEVFSVRERVAEAREETPKSINFYKYVFDRTIISSPDISNKVIFKIKSLGIAHIEADTQNPYYATLKFRPKEITQFKVRVTRVKAFSRYNYRTLDKLSLINLSTRFDRDPIKTDKRHVFLEVRIRATNQLNGSVNNLSALAESILDVYDSEKNVWVKQKTDNPAWIFCDLITGNVNKRPLSKDRLHLPSIIEWANFCEEVPTPPPTQSFVLPRFTCNFILDFDTTLQSLINNVTNSAQASLNIIDGKYGVLLDKLKTVPVQIFTPRNSSNFSSSRSYDNSPHALKVRYIDPFKNWEILEAIVYDDGYTEDTATEFDEVSAFACTNYEQAWRYGRYMLAQARLRKERITIDVDFEHIVCTRGDYVQVTQDVMRVGGTPARVKEIIGPNTIKIDDGIATIAGVSYGYVFRGVNGIDNDSCTVIDSDTIQLDGPMPSVGDLIVIGESTKVVFDCLVKSINPSSDLTATIELVEKADDVYLAESSDVIPPYNPRLTLNVDSFLAAPPAVEDLVVTANTYRVVGFDYQYYISLDWDLPIGSAAEIFEVYVDNGQGYDLNDFTKASLFEYIVDPKYLDIPHNFKVLAVSATGKKITLLEAPSVSATPVKKITAPSDVVGLNLNITNEVLQIDWRAVLDPDLREYLIRYSPKTSGAIWESSIPLLRVDRNTTLASTQARTGTYFIKAVDLNYNESLKAAQAVTSIPNLTNLNIIEETNDFPSLQGEKVTTEFDLSGLTLKRKTSGGSTTNEYFSEGFYYYSNFLDLGEIYTVRLQSLIEAEGFTVADLMTNWDPLSELERMSLAGQSDWDVETQYRTTDTFNVIAEWTQLSQVDPLSEGTQDNWSDWRKFTIGDATGRIFQFRLRLISNVASVTPRVYEGKIRSDMPDRFEVFNNLIAPIEGLEIFYSPAFKGPGVSPNVQITQDFAQSGDYFVLSNKTLEGLKINFYDVNGVPVSRQFDAAIKGYGRRSLSVI